MVITSMNHAQVTHDGVERVIHLMLHHAHDVYLMNFYCLFVSIYKNIYY